MPDLRAPEAWAHLPFFQRDLPVIRGKLAEETRTVYPPAALVFRALDLSPPDKTRVVILGQDPYHTPGKADGLSFSIPQEFGGRLDSLGNIFKEIESDLGQSRTRTDLTDWAKQGVLLLNTALTVPEGKALGHAKVGWTHLTRDVLIALSDRPRAFVFWGNNAQGFAKYVTGADHLVLRTAHPSPLSAHRGFFGTRPFSQINAWLKARGDSPIHWTDP
ncbi:uracil-DNA glycosylase [Puniceibacterium sediminis]|uniref:Uracil-DNA glycosylase n=1 Tax=Puniceibacterium sediminis TaxID=1608407 RepID=A0A238W3K6_9RHOB|nr:uracil-DNA glycosylase [Puniceibacterium sediminis]SNR40924.1 Uracil-DNA glycosylase [Puniceibacterium sediminis]